MNNTELKKRYKEITDKLIFQVSQVPLFRTKIAYDDLIEQISNLQIQEKDGEQYCFFDTEELENINKSIKKCEKELMEADVELAVMKRDIQLLKEMFKEENLNEMEE